MSSLVESDVVSPVASASSQTIQVLRATASLVDRAIAKALEPHGLTAVQFSVLQVMADAEDQQLGCGELGKRLNGPSSDVTRLLDRLETGGLVSRERDKDDRRVVHTRISDRGRELLALAAPAVRTAEQQALATLDQDGQAQLTALLNAVRQNVPVG